MAGASEKAAFRGWWIVAVGLLSQAITVGLTIIPFGFFTTPIVEEFGASRAQVQAGLALFMLAMTGAGGLVGRLLDRGSIRAVMACGSLTMAACFLALSFATALWQLGALFGVGVAFGVAMAGPLPATTVIAKWFDRKRGAAVGVAATGPLVGGALLTPLVGVLLESSGWRGTLQVFAGISAMIAPFALLVVRNSPDELGQLVDGAPATSPVDEDVSVTPPLEPGEILRSRNFWALALGIGLVFGFGGGWGANVPPFGEDMGYSAQHMSLLIGVSSGLGVLSTLAFGALADRLDNRALLWAAIGAQTAALLLLFSLPADPLFTLGVLLFGFAGGGLLPVYASFIGRLFGAASFGSVMGLGGLVMLPFATAAPVIAGSIRDTTGSYVLALFSFALALTFGAALLAAIRRPARETAEYVGVREEPA
jgi:MFS family permease